MPGLTSVDVRATRSEIKARPRSRLLSWISGDYADDVPTKAEALAVAPPDHAVQQEILRLQIEAELADLQAEADAIAADALVESGSPEVGAAEESSSDEQSSPVEDGTADPAADATAGPAADATAPAAIEEPPSDADAGSDGPLPPEASSAPDAAANEALEREQTRRELEAQIAELQARVDAISPEGPSAPPEDPASA